LLSPIDYKSFLGRHDLYWPQPPKTWDESAFLGNGMLGAAVYGAEHKSHRQTLRFVMGREDVVARRPSAFAARVPVGEFELQFGSWIYGGTTMKLDLWNAQLNASVVTVKGSARLSAFLHSRKDVLLLELQTGDETASFRFVPYPEVSEALKVDDGRPNIDQYFPETAVQQEERDGVSFTRQRYNGSADGCTAALLCVPAGEGKVRYYATIQQGHDAAAAGRAERLLRDAAAEPAENFRQSHRSWWHDYYRRSFLSLPDTRLEGFYWAQLYKLGSATRPDSPTLDNQGPWMGPTPWPGTWFNMNVQVAYSPVYASNHLEEGESLCRALDRNLPNLIANVPEELRADSAGLGRSMSHDFSAPVGAETGNLLWACHNYYRQYRYSMDEELLRTRLYPLLRRAVGFHLHLLREGEDGRLHLPATISPEYGSFKQLAVEDCGYDLFLLRWGLCTLLNSARRLGLSEAEEPRWRETLEKLAENPADETGYLIGKGVRMDHGHRHYSHLLGVSPLHIVDVENPVLRERVRVSLRHWFGREGDLRGFTFSGAASIAAALGEGDEALSYLLSGLLLCKPNTFYREAGPVIESPLGMAEAVHDLLLQSHSGVVEVFPALPSGWADVSFQSLRAEGAFLVSAQRRAGKVQFIHIRSLAGEPLRVRCRLFGGGPVLLQDGGGRRELLPDPDGCFTVPLAKGEEAALFPAGTAGTAEIAVAPVEAQRGLCNFWGGNKPWRLYGIPFAEEAP
jgi:alpha-L-fucosidase 2